MSHCDCSERRRFHGAAFATFLLLPRAGFTVRAGAEYLAAHRNTRGVERTFCRRCGSSLFGEAPGQDRWIEVAAGTLDGDPGLRPCRHIFVGSQAPWHEISDDLPQYDACQDTAAEPGGGV